MLAVPGAQVTIQRGARVRLEAADQWSQIAVIEGKVRFSSPSAEMDLAEGEMARVDPANRAKFYLYREMAVYESDRWSEARDKVLASAASSTHLPDLRYGCRIWMRPARGSIPKHSAPSGSRSRRMVGRRIVTAAGPGTTISAIRGSRTMPGDGCRTTTGVGRAPPIWAGSGYRAGTQSSNPGMSTGCAALKWPDGVRWRRQRNGRRAACRSFT